MYRRNGDRDRIDDDQVTVELERVRTIIVDGSTIYLATAGGGVWKRTDGVWTPITETIGTLSCGSLAMDPANLNVLYLGLGDPLDGTSTGLGMLKSVDGGANWRRRSS